MLSDVVAFVGWVGLNEKVVVLVGSGPLSDGRGESGWCSDVTSTHGAWRHAGVRFLFSGVPLLALWNVHGVLALLFQSGNSAVGSA